MKERNPEETCRKEGKGSWEGKEAPPMIRENRQLVTNKPVEFEK
jgi:hypothetical protein